MAEFASKGVAGAGLGFGIAGTALGLMAGGLNGNWFNGGVNGCCSENTPVTRFELGQEQRIAQLESQVALRDANIFTDSKINELGAQTRVALDAIRAELRDVAVYQGVNTATVQCLSGKVNGIQNVLDGLTKTIIPSSNVCNQEYPVVVQNTACKPVYTHSVSSK